MISRIEISARLKALADRRYEDRDTVTPGSAFEAFGKLNREIVALYDELEQLSKEVLA